MASDSVLKKIPSFRLSYHQRELLVMLLRMPDGYLEELMPKQPSNDLLAVVSMYKKLCEERV